MGGTGLLAALVFWHALPPSRRFVRQKLRWRDSIEGLALHFRDPALCWLYATAFLIMGGFVTIYNYLGYRLLAPPFGFSQTAVGALFSVYVVGIVASGLAARLAERFGRRRMLWIAVAVQLAGLELTLGRTTLPVVGGVAVLTGGFFGAHSIASAWVARRATSRRAQAASLYMLFYYLGSSLVGSLGGVVFADHGWSGLVLLLSLLGCVSLGVAFRLSVIPTLAVPGAIRHDASDVTRRGMTG
jgi:YNFM family putative membrane transporter